MEEICLGIEETNRIRLELGLPPLEEENGKDQKPTPSNAPEESPSPKTRRSVEALRSVLDQRKQERLALELGKGPGLADTPDAGWDGWEIRRQTTPQSASAARPAPSAPVSDEVRIAAHSDHVLEGQSVIMTLADGHVLEDADDVLENVHLREADQVRRYNATRRRMASSQPVYGEPELEDEDASRSLRVYKVSSAAPVSPSSKAVPSSSPRLPVSRFSVTSVVQPPQRPAVSSRAHPETFRSRKRFGTNAAPTTVLATLQPADEAPAVVDEDHGSRHSRPRSQAVAEDQAALAADLSRFDRAMSGNATSSSETPFTSMAGSVLRRMLQNQNATTPVREPFKETEGVVFLDALPSAPRLTKPVEPEQAERVGSAVESVEARANEVTSSSKRGWEAPTGVEEVQEGRGVSSILGILRKRGGSAAAPVETMLAGRANDPVEDPALRLARSPDDASSSAAFNLEYRNARGQRMTIREAFRDLSASFHGVRPGKNKQAKRLKREEDLRRVLHSEAQDTPLHMVQRAYATAEAHATPYLVLSNPKETFLSKTTPQSSDEKLRTLNDNHTNDSSLKNPL